MRWKPPHTRRVGDMDATMTPMIDVVFLLMIFFVCTASFQALEQTLPTPLEAGASGAVEPSSDPELDELEEVVIRVAGEDQNPPLLVGATPCADLAALGAALRSLAAADAGLPVTLSVAPEVPLGQVIDVYDLCRLVGFERVQFAAPRQGG